MVCPRCLSSVRTILDSLKILYKNVELGKVELITELSDSQKTELAQNLEVQGFELLNSEESKIINTIKSFVIDKVHYGDHLSNINLSEELAKLIHKDYSAISKMFSRTEGITIEQYLLRQRIEKVKELLSYHNLNVSEIANELGFSSTAHLSSQFKKITGMTPSAFSKLNVKPRIEIDTI